MPTTFDDYMRVGTLAVAIWGAWLATVGINAWKRQLVGQSEYEVAKRILVHSYMLIRMVKALRPVGGGELPPMNNDIFRVNAEFENAIAEGQAHWGDEIVSLRRPIGRYVTKILDARGKLSKGSQLKNGERQEIDELFDLTSESKPNLELRNAQEAMKTFLMPYLGASARRKKKAAVAVPQPPQLPPPRAERRGQ